MEWNNQDWAVIQNGLLAIQNNPWGAINSLSPSTWSQAVRVNEDGNFEARWDYPVSSFDPSKVIAYPEVIYGNKFGDVDTDAPDMPFQVRDMKRVDITYGHEMQQGSTVNNVAIETFFHTSADVRITNKEFELMVWLESPSDTSIVPGKLYGSFKNSDGITYDIYVKRNDRRYVAFIAQETVTSGKFCWSDFITAVNTVDDLDNINPDWYIGAFEYGPEIWTGMGSFTWLQFLVETELNGSSATDPVLTPVVTGASSEFWRQVAYHHHQLSVHHNKLATLYEILQDEQIQ